MKNKNSFKFLKHLLTFLFFSQITYSQLSSFTFNVTPTNESCLGNGILTFNVSGTVSGSSMDYAVYLLPNIITPLAVLTTSSLTGLNAGNYRVIATQSLGVNSATKQQDVTIVSTISTLTYTLVGTKVKCENDGAIAVNVTSGTPFSYQILSGPITTPVQTSSVFTNLPVGIYQIRVFDTCNEGVVQTFTLLQASVSLVIDSVSFQTTILPTCNTILVSNAFGVLTGFEIALPLIFQYTVYPPASGTPIIYTQEITSGAMASQIIPFYNNQSYYYDLKVTDACGNVYNKNNNIVNKKFDFSSAILKLNCTDIALKLTPEFYVAPYTINFLSFPVGFNPVSFNSSHPGPFSESDTIYGSVGNSFPVGNYSIQITDSCGRTMIKNVFVVNIPPMPIAVGSNNGCGDLSILITSIQLVSVIMINAPVTYTIALPHDYSSLISADGLQFFISGLPQGTYTFSVTDSCGFINNVSATVSGFTPGPISLLQRPGCELSFGSVIVNAPNGISTATLIAAPSSYSGVMPVNLSANILAGTFYFGSVAQGNYTFQFTNNCGVLRTDTIFVEGYSVTTNLVTITENCGSFNLFLENVSNGNFLQSFWLQKYNSITNEWVNPITGAVYVDGTSLSTINSIALLNNTNNLNLAFIGQFRVLKTFKSLVDTQYVNCFQVVNSFDFSGGPKITNVYAFLCSATTNEVIVEATGVPPLNYSITTQNGNTFVLNNGTQNSFTNLAPATYNFQVQDVCGNIVNSLFDITALEPFTIEATTFCNGQVGMLSVPLFSFLNYQWWQGTDTTTIISTSNVLSFSPYISSTDSGVYHVRITNPSNTTSCVDITLDYTIPTDVNIPNAGLDNSINYCGSQGIVNLNTLINGTFDTTGTWQELSSSGFLLDNLWNSSTVLSGTYQFKYRVEGSCASFDESFITITINEIPQSPISSANSIVCESGNLELFATTVLNASYQWNGPIGFTSIDQNPIITNVSTINNGIYSVKTLANGCESIPSSVEISVSLLPQFSIETSCINNISTLTATMLLDTFDATTAVYNWSNYFGYTSTTNPTNITGESIGIYTVTITNNLGCATTNTFNVLNTLCSIPNGISPNGDGNNDAFDLSGFSEIEKVKIFNRYGMVIFEQDNYVNQWKGQDYRGNLLPSGTYYYVVNFATSEAKTGWVYLSRE